jgi:peptide/nickel transport system ATP-binding protein
MSAHTPSSPADAAPALAFEGVSVVYRERRRETEVLHDLSFAVQRGEALGLVGESGCGKSTAALAAIAALPGNGRVRHGVVRAGGRVLAGLDATALRAWRAHDVAMVFQDPGRALNPTLTVGRQLREAFEAAGMPRAETETAAPALLEAVRIAAGERVMASYPHQISGGMQQRVVIAMALAKRPGLLILDEPTTGLDATVAADILDLLGALRRETGMAMLLISHDLPTVGRVCDRIGVLYGGRLVEQGPVAAVFDRPGHPYTARLLHCIPQPGQHKGNSRLATIPGTLPAPHAPVPACVFAPRCTLATELCRTTAPPTYALDAALAHHARCHYHELAALPEATLSVAAPGPRDPLPAPERGQPATPPIAVLRAEGISKRFALGRGEVQALRDVSLELYAGETLGLVGESGSGKTTLARILLGLSAADTGRLELDGHPLASAVARRTPGERRALQAVAQHPDTALNRVHRVRRLVGRALIRPGGVARRDVAARLSALLEAVHMPERYLSARPRALSGGLKQRVAIARAFAGEPRVIVCDEPTSALDVSVQAVILNLLADLQAERKVSYLLISHDLRVIRFLADRIVVLYGGVVVETGPAAALFDGPRHPYTDWLLAAAAGPVPGVGARSAPASGPADATGCVFRDRCPYHLGDICDTVPPPFTDASHPVRCHIPAVELRRRQSRRSSGGKPI